jgi:DNA polymerase-3 subunit gamma/tau
MMPSLARRHRPKRLADLVGQDALVQTLTAGLAKGQTAQAYVLTGIRGVGKTTTARILARALNCETGPTAEPCGRCDSCRAFDAESHPALIEIDAASQSGVESIRALLEQIPYAPMMGRTKVVVIDEAHGLSRPAWDALLKTLEEPPPHVVFVFATTEARKIPATILSRCQTFALKRISPADVEARLAAICAAEGIPVAPGALAAVALAGEGSMRDALTLLDQARLRADGAPVTPALVAEMLGTAGIADVLALAERALARDARGTLDLLRRLRAQGALAEPLAQDLAQAAVLCAETALDPTTPATLPPKAQETARAIAQAHGPAGASALYAAMAKTIPDLRESHDPDAALEMALLRFAWSPA